MDTLERNPPTQALGAGDALCSIQIVRTLTEDRFTAARRAAAAMHIEPDLVLDSPYVLIGTADEIAAQLQRDHRRFGLTRWTIFADRPDLQPAEALAPVIALLRG